MARRRSARRKREAQFLAAYVGLIVVAAVFSVLTWVAAHPLILVVLAALAAVGISIRLQVGQRRPGEAEQRRQRNLYEHSYLEVADAMSGTQFEEHIGGLLRLDGCRDVRIVGGPGDGGADILATEPSGRSVVIQCKRQLAPIPVSVVRQLIGSLAHEHPGRHGVLVTTAQLTRPASNLAASAGIVVVDRPQLARWMAGARQRIEHQPVPATPIPGGSGVPGPGWLPKPRTPWQQP